MAMLNESNLLAMKAKAAKFRTHHVGTKLNEAEFALLEERARGVGMRLAEWVREALLSAPVESVPDSGEVALGEILSTPQQCGKLPKPLSTLKNLAKNKCRTGLLHLLFLKYTRKRQAPHHPNPTDTSRPPNPEVQT